MYRKKSSVSGIMELVKAKSPTPSSGVVASLRARHSKLLPVSLEEVSPPSTFFFFG